ncbi:Rnh70p PWA37_003905 [Arxiozyma heterogenica]|uniref:Exonuclease domain-containing protein n=1 Tax=Arxiozyma heterogenica TaxID=278026 RepID=A0AAN7W0Z9_9SACH|nr:hypothetical protein RI543_002943 [Kazachstania heterogenica]
MIDPTSPNVSPKKSSELSLPSQDLNLNINKPQSVRNEVARLNINETDNVKTDIVNSLNSSLQTIPYPTTTSSSNHVKRRRSSATLSSNQLLNLNSTNQSNEDQLEQNSVTLGKIAKKKKRNSSDRPFDIKILDKFFYYEEPNKNHTNKKTDHDNVNNLKQNIKKKYRISIKDIRDLILFLMYGTNNSPQWVNISNRSSLTKLVVLFIPGLEPQDYNLPVGSSFFLNSGKLRKQKLQYSRLTTDIAKSQTFTHFENTAVCAPGSRLSLFSAYNTFVNVGLTKNEKIALKNELSKKKVTVYDLLLPLSKLLENNYPIHVDTPNISDDYKTKLIEIQRNEESSSIWVDTKPSLDDSESHIYGLDCEMCMSETGFVVTRVSLVNFQNETIYDELVKPDVPITDYLTKYSGITKEKLDPVTRSLKDVQQDIINLISSNDILVGHSLQSDLNVLKLRHPKIIDTAIIYDHKAGPPFKPSLKFLVSEYLNYSIQEDVNNGHNSIEDAKACINLLKSKILHGMAFGKSVDTENLFERLAKKSYKRAILLNDSVVTNVSSADSNYISCVRCQSDKEIMENIISQSEKYDLFVGRLRDLEFVRQYSTPSLLSMRQVPSIEDNGETNIEDVIIDNFLKELDSLYNNLPSNSLIVLLSGSGDTKNWTRLMNELNKCDTKEEKMKKRESLENDIEKSVVKARDGVATFIVKN